MKVIDRLAVIRRKNKINKNLKHNNIFRILQKNKIWLLADENINSNKKNLKLEITTKSLDKISIQRLVRLQDKILNENYTFKSIDEIKSSKLNKQKLQITDEKIVQDETAALNNSKECKRT